jgi:hypothetical protein
MTRYTNFLAIGAVLLVTACGSNLKELSTEEKERFQTTLATIGNSTKALAVIGDKKNDVTSKLFDSMASGPATKDSDEMARRLQQAVANKECEVVSNIPTNLGTGKNLKLQDVRMVVKGVTCPISVDLKMSMEGTEKSGSGNFTLKYEIKENGFKKLAQIDRVELSGSLNFSANVPTDDRSDMSMKFALDIHGTAHSIEEGDLKTYLRGNYSMNGNPKDNRMNGGGEFKFGVQFKDFTGELKTVSTFNTAGGKAEAKYFVNDKEITEKEMQEWMTAANLPSIPGSTPAR